MPCQLTVTELIGSSNTAGELVAVTARGNAIECPGCNPQVFIGPHSAGAATFATSSDPTEWSATLDLTSLPDPGPENPNLGTSFGCGAVVLVTVRCADGSNEQRISLPIDCPPPSDTPSCPPGVATLRVFRKEDGVDFTHIALPSDQLYEGCLEPGLYVVEVIDPAQNEVVEFHWYSDGTPLPIETSGRFKVDVTAGQTAKISVNARLAGPNCWRPSPIAVLHGCAEGDTDDESEDEPKTPDPLTPPPAPPWCGIALATGVILFLIGLVLVFVASCGMLAVPAAMVVYAVAAVCLVVGFILILLWILKCLRRLPDGCDTLMKLIQFLAIVMAIEVIAALILAGVGVLCGSSAPATGPFAWLCTFFGACSFGAALDFGFTAFLNVFLVFSYAYFCHRPRAQP